MADAIDEHQLAQRARSIRSRVVELGWAAGSFGAHYGPALSLVEIMTVLYGATLRIKPETKSDPARDRLILSKGHGSLALYSALSEFGFIPDSVLATCEQDGSLLPGQPARNHDLGIEYSSGSLGMGLSFGLGLALSAKRRGMDRRCFVVMGDGETNEGSVWEAAMAASHHEVGNLVAIVDVNDMQSDGPTDSVLTMRHEALWAAHGWRVATVDGHSIAELTQALQTQSATQPFAMLARTIKGKGVSFMEHSADWHHGVLQPAQYETAKSETSPEMFERK